MQLSIYIVHICLNKMAYVILFFNILFRLSMMLKILWLMIIFYLIDVGQMQK